MDIGANLVSSFRHGSILIRSSPAVASLRSVLLGIVFGRLTGIDRHIGCGVAYDIDLHLSMQSAMIALMGIYVGAVYGGSYGFHLINIPGTLLLQLLR
jgi:putative tricarboxylic transport membrane protein